MAATSHGVGGLTFDAKKRSWPPEANVFVALVLITLVFEVLNRIDGGSFLFNTRANVSGSSTRRAWTSLSCRWRSPGSSRSA